MSADQQVPATATEASRLPVDLKYGDVRTQHGSWGDGEPVFILRARDALSGQAIRGYASICRAAGADEAHLVAIEAAASQFELWQAAGNETKLPDSGSDNPGINVGQ